MWQKIRVVFTIPELRQKILLTLGLLAIYRIGWQIPMPIVDTGKMTAFFGQQQGAGLGALIEQAVGRHEHVPLLAVDVEFRIRDDRRRVGRHPLDLPLAIANRRGLEARDLRGRVVDNEAIADELVAPHLRGEV